MRKPLALALALAILAGPAAAPAQAIRLGVASSKDEPAAAEPAAPAPEVAPDSPRAAVARFLQAARRGRYAEAADYLELAPGTTAAESAALARKLLAVLDRRARIDLETLSPLSGGEAADDLPRGIDQVAGIPGEGGATEPVRMVRRETPAGPRWLFTRATLEQVETWYGGLEDRWIRELLPEPLLRHGPRGLLWWQWAALPVFALLAWLLGRALGFLFRLVARRLALRTATSLDERLLDRTRGPTTLFFATAVAYAALPLLALYRPAEELAHLVLRSLLLVVFFWGIFRIVEVIGEIALAGPWAQAHPSSRALVPLLVRAGKIAFVPLAVVAGLSELGYPVASILAGLGIGGLALALAAQKTVEHVFGSVSIGIDQPFRIGDFVKVEDFLGTVESIGLRSTRFRTLDRTLITIPNGKLAETRVESYTARDRIRLHSVFYLDYGTTAAQVREILAGIEAALRAHPRIYPDDMTIRLSAIGPNGMEITVMAWFLTQEFSVFTGFRQEMLLAFLEVVERAGTRIAPTTTVSIAPGGHEAAGRG